jgi:crossover junction endodeoxyribonuclease RusA
MADEWLLHLPYTVPPLTENQRFHWRKKARIVKETRQLAFLMARGIPALGRCEVHLIWYVSTKRRRDEDNIVPTLKALCDGLVDAGIVVDDTREFMLKPMPEIVQLGKGEGTARMTLSIVKIVV